MNRLERVPVRSRRVRRGIGLALVTAGLALTSLVGLQSAEAKGTPPGADVARGNTVCADHGGFGALGTFGPGAHDIGVNNPGSNRRPGATSWMFPNVNTGSTTGGNNNSLCGGGNVPSPFVAP